MEDNPWYWPWSSTRSALVPLCWSSGGKKTGHGNFPPSSYHDSQSGMGKVPNALLWARMEMKGRQATPHTQREYSYRWECAQPSAGWDREVAPQTTWNHQLKRTYERDTKQPQDVRVAMEPACHHDSGDLSSGALAAQGMSGWKQEPHSCGSATSPRIGVGLSGGPAKRRLEGNHAPTVSWPRLSRTVSLLWA